MVKLIDLQISSDPNNTFWTSNKNRFGMKMLKKWGWTEGSGLGKNEQGETNHIEIKKKDDNTGVGGAYNHSENWQVNNENFDSILANLNKKYASSSEDTTENTSKKKKKKSKKISKVTKKDKEIKKEKKSKIKEKESKKKSKKNQKKEAEKKQLRVQQIRYQKIMLSKSVRNYSAKDLKAIMGENTESNYTPINIKSNKEVDEDEKDPQFTVSKTSTNQYFSKKLEEKSKKRKQPDCSTIEEEDKTLEPKKKKQKIKKNKTKSTKKNKKK